MALVTLRIPDEIYEIYRDMNPTNPVHMMEKQLTRFKDVDAHERAVILTKEARQALEKLFGKPIEDTKVFAEWVKKLVALKIEGLDFPLKEGQRKKLEGLANFYHRDLSEYAKAHISRVIDQDLGNF